MSTLSDLVGLSLGTRVVQYDEEDAILYALAVGARAEDLDLVLERRLRVLPTFAAALGLWACDALAARGVFSPESALHGAQTLEIRSPLPTRARLELHAGVAAVWDKGRSAVVDVETECEYFRAMYSIFLPGRGGWGGPRGVGSTPGSIIDSEPTWVGGFLTTPEQAALYRLTGDRHLIHIDPDAARAAGLPGVILHGLCTLGIAAREIAAAVGAHPSDLRKLEARFASPVIPGAQLELRGSAGSGGLVRFSACSGDDTVLTAGRATFDIAAEPSPGSTH